MIGLAQMILAIECLPGLCASQGPLNVSVFRSIQACKANQRPSFIAKICDRWQRTINQGGMQSAAASAQLYSKEESQEALQKKIHEGRSDFARDTCAVLKKKIASIIATVRLMPACNEKNYWDQVILAYAKKDITQLETLQYQHPAGGTPPTEILFFILSVLDAQEESATVTLASMSLVRQGAFFKKITGSE